MGTFMFVSCSDPADSTVEETVLELTSEDCRNTGSAMALGTTWTLTEPVPRSWQELSPVEGVIRAGESPFGTFEANGVSVVVADVNGEPEVALSLECFPWVAE